MIISLCVCCEFERTNCCSLSSAFSSALHCRSRSGCIQERQHTLANCCSQSSAFSSALCCRSRSDCHQERQYTLANRCSLSSAVSSALCCRSRSLLQSLSCRTASAHVLGVLAMMRTTARADRKELSAKNALCRSSMERWHGNYRTGIALFLCPAALL